MKWTNEQYQSYLDRRQRAAAVVERGSRPWEDWEIAALKAAYSDINGINLHLIALRLNRTHAAVSCKADQLGITSQRGENIRTESHRSALAKAQKRRFESSTERERVSKQSKQWHANNEHPRGFLGKHHGQEAREAISKANSGVIPPKERVDRQQRTRRSRYGSIAPAIRRGSWRAEWIEVGGVRLFARSRWEANYARYLEWLKSIGEIKQWEHEPRTFWFSEIQRGTCSYLPDFRLVKSNGEEEWHEVKGWMDARSKTKIRRMAKYYPEIILRIIDGSWFKVANRKFASIVPGWDTLTRLKPMRSNAP